MGLLEHNHHEQRESTKNMSNTTAVVSKEKEEKGHFNSTFGIPGWRSGLAPAFGPGCDPGDPGSNPTSGSWCMEPASPSAYVSASFSLSLTIINK